MCLCQHDGGEGCYSDLMNPSAFKGHSLSRTQAKQTSSNLGASPAAGGLRISFSKAVQQGRAQISIEFILFFPWNIVFSKKRLLRLKALHPTLLSFTELSIALFGFSATIDNSWGEFGTRSEAYSTACAPGEWQLLMSSPLSDLAPLATSMKNGWRAGGGGVMKRREVGTEGSVIRIMNPRLSGIR